MQVDSPAKPELSPTAEEMPSDVTPPPVHEKGSTEPTAEHTFQLYDLRVEVVCPPGKRILCGAKPGDYFTLEGELLKLPPGQGFSIYSLGKLATARPTLVNTHADIDWIDDRTSPRRRAPLARRETARRVPARLDDDRRRGRVS